VEFQTGVADAYQEHEAYGVGGGEERRAFGGCVSAQRAPRGASLFTSKAITLARMLCVTIRVSVASLKRNWNEASTSLTVKPSLTTISLTASLSRIGYLVTSFMVVNQFSPGG